MDATPFIHCESSFPCFFDDEDDIPVPLPPRSPSRLDFCIEDLDDGDNSESHAMDWAGTYLDTCPYTLIEEDTFPVDVAPPDRPRVVVPKSFLAEPLQDEDIEEIIVQPRAPIPVRPPSVQLRVDVQEHTPSHTTTQRLNYPHHGFSRSALLQQKNFWSSRQEEWAEWQSRTTQKQESTTSDAYTDLATVQPPAVESTPPYMRTPPSGLERDFADHPPKKHEQDVHAAIYPRAGDISALRDPYSMLYMFNMHQRSAASSFDTSSIQSSTSSSTLSSHSSSSSGEDDESDCTLVADDSLVTKGRLSLRPSKCATSFPSLPWNPFWGWSWYARWEVLTGLFQRDTLDMSTKLADPHRSKVSPSSPPAPIFRFTVEGEDDDDDYGTIISTSTFNVDFETGCERAVTFSSRELKRAEVVL